MRIRPDQLAALQNAEGTRLLEAIREVDPGPADTLALVTRLRAEWEADLVAAAMTIHTLRRRASGRLAHADRLWLTGDGLEQATASPIAAHRAERFAGCDRVADLCCGIGGDLMTIAARADIASLLAVDRDPLHLAMAEANARIVRPDVDLTAVAGDAETADLAGVDGVFLDPARRAGGRRTTSRGGSRTGPDAVSPPLPWAFELAERVARVGVTVAPSYPHEGVPDGWELECLAVGTALKEGVLWSPALATAMCRATVLTDSGISIGVATLTDEPGEGEDVPLVEPAPGTTVIDPSPAVTRAGLVQTLARRLGAGMIDPRIAFLVTPEPVDTPFGRALTVLASMPWHERRVRAALDTLGAGAVDVRRRGLPGDVDVIARRLRGPGHRPLTVLMTRRRDQPWAVIVEDPARG